MVDVSFFESRKIKKIAVYGMDTKGKKLYEALLRMGLEVIGIEKLSYARDNNYDVYYMHEEEIPETDAVVIVPEREFDFIKWELYNFISDRCKVLRMSEIYV